jgi:anti-sigma B factor antagonist
LKESNKIKRILKEETMKIEQKADGSNLTLEIEGRLDTTTAPALEKELDGVLGNITSLVLDFAKLDYISSAGLRVVLSAQKTMQSKGGMVIKNVNESIMEVFEITGFKDILTIE